MASFDVKEFQDYLEDLPDELQGLLDKLVSMYAQKIVNDAQHNAPKITGYLARSINMKLQKDSKDRTEATIYAGAEYGWYVEFGRPNRQPKPFFFPAYAKWSEKFYDALIDAVEDVIK